MNQVNAQTDPRYWLPEVMRQKPIDQTSRTQVMTNENQPAYQACPSNSMNRCVDRSHKKLIIEDLVANFNDYEGSKRCNPSNAFEFLE
jgi:hypothetical protein